MYGLPSDPKVDVFKGQTLIQICFGANDLILNFSGDLSIGIYSCVGLGTIHQAVTKYHDFTAIAGELLKLLSTDVMDVSWSREGTVSIKFPGSIIEVYDDSQQFESYTINTPNGLVVV